MNVTPAMIMPMEMTMSNSSNENPRFLPDVIGTLSGEEKPPVERALHPFTGNTGKIAVSARTKGRVRDLHRVVLIVGTDQAGVKARGANAGAWPSGHRAGY